MASAKSKSEKPEVKADSKPASLDEVIDAKPVRNLTRERLAADESVGKVKAAAMVKD